jgi:hypothetical protein
MISFIVKNNVNHFVTVEEETELQERIKNIFGLPFPHELKISLLPESFKKIQHFYQFMKENKINKLSFYLSTKEGNKFIPLHNGCPFDSNEYIDYDKKIFKTFKTESLYVEIDMFYENITFEFIYMNSYTEECFKYSYPIKKLLSL